jgi:putative endonuclease
MYCVYILRCADGSLYTGIARDADERLIVHNSGKGAKYTASRRPVTIVYREVAPTRSAALRRERHIKSCSRAKKEALVSENPQATANSSAMACPEDRSAAPIGRVTTAGLMRSRPVCGVPHVRKEAE